MGEAIDRLVKLTRIVVPPHIRRVDGQTVRVDGYTYDADRPYAGPGVDRAYVTRRVQNNIRAIREGGDARQANQMQAYAEDEGILYRPSTDSWEAKNPSPRPRWNVPKSGSQYDSPDYDSDAARDEEIASAVGRVRGMMGQRSSTPDEFREPGVPRLPSGAPRPNWMGPGTTSPVEAKRAVHEGIQREAREVWGWDDDGNPPPITLAEMESVKNQLAAKWGVTRTIVDVLLAPRR